MIMKFLSRFLNSDEKVKKTCISIYEKAKKKRPGKPEREYLKIVLLTKPPFDYQHNKVIDFILDRQATNIEKLANFIVEHRKDKDMWENRERNLTSSIIKDRNKEFFRKFWGR